MKSFYPSWVSVFGLMYLLMMFVVTSLVFLLILISLVLTNNVWIFTFGLLLDLLFLLFLFKKTTMKKQEITISQSTITFPEKYFLGAKTGEPRMFSLKKIKRIDVRQFWLGFNAVYPFFVFYFNKDDKSYMTQSDYVLRIPWRKKDVQGILDYLSEKTSFNKNCLKVN